MPRLNTLRPRQNGRHFPDDIFKWIFLNENVWISINISLKFVPKGPINNIPTLVQVMAWRRPGDKPLSEPMMVRLPTHICVTRLQWVKVQWWTNTLNVVSYSSATNHYLYVLSYSPVIGKYPYVVSYSSATNHYLNVLSYSPVIGKYPYVVSYSSATNHYLNVLSYSPVIGKYPYVVSCSSAIDQNLNAVSYILAMDRHWKTLVLQFSNGPMIQCL